MIFSSSKRQLIDYSFLVPNGKTALGTKENPQARRDFEMQMLASPRSGIIPFDIRKREFAFEKKITNNAEYKKANARTAQSNWDLAGPFNVGGRTRGAAIDVRNSDIIIAAGASGAIWKTTDEGSSWIRKTSPEVHNGISWLIQDTRLGKQNIWYASTGEQVGNSARGVGAPYRGNGILKSIDNGENWEFLTSTQSSDPQIFNSQFQYTWNMLINTTKTSIDELWLASYGGILKSPDGGETWEVVLGNKLFDLPSNTNINESTDPSFTHIFQNQNGHFFSSLSAASSTQNNVNGSSCSERTGLYEEAGYFFSADGELWTEITPPTLSRCHERTVIGSGNSSPGNIYFLAHTGDDNNELWLYTYTAINNGVPNGTWQNLTDNIPMFGGETGDFEAQSGYNMLVNVHPENANIVYLAGTNLYRSTDGFKTDNNTKWIGGYLNDGSTSQYPLHHADQHLLLFYPDDANKVLSCHDGGMSVSTSITKDSVIYRDINNGYLTSQFYTITQQQDEVSDIMLGGLQDNGAYIRESIGINPAWSRLIQGDGAYMAISPEKNFVYVGLQKGVTFRLSLNKSNQLSGFARIDPPGAGEETNQEYLFINPYILDPLNGNKMFLAGGDAIWRNRNLAQIPNGSNDKTNIGWEELRDTRISEGIYTALNKSQDVLYAGVFRPANSSGAMTPTILKIESASFDDQEVFTKSLPNIQLPESGYISCIKADPENKDFVLITLANYEIPSIFLSTDGAESFTDVSGNLEEFEDGTGDGPSVRWIEIAQTQTGNKYYVGTSIGLFSTSLLDGSNTTWIKEAESVIGRSIVTMINYRGLDGRLIVATHGNGTFRSFIENPRTIDTEIEADFTIEQNYPNPFNDETLIKYTLPEDGLVRIDIYDTQGQRVKNLLWGQQYAGQNSVSWDGLSSYGSVVRNGVYYFSLNYNGKIKSKRMVFIR